METKMVLILKLLLGSAPPSQIPTADFLYAGTFNATLKNFTLVNRYSVHLMENSLAERGSSNSRDRIKFNYGRNDVYDREKRVWIPRVFEYIANPSCFSAAFCASAQRPSCGSSCTDLLLARKHLIRGIDCCAGDIISSRINMRTIAEYIKIVVNYLYCKPFSLRDLRKPGAFRVFLSNHWHFNNLNIEMYKNYNLLLSEFQKEHLTDPTTTELGREVLGEHLRVDFNWAWTVNHMLIQRCVTIVRNNLSKIIGMAPLDEQEILSRLEAYIKKNVHDPIEAGVSSILLNRIPENIY